MLNRVNINCLPIADGQAGTHLALLPINPSDLAVLHGRYGFRPEPPFVPGGEGSGTVVATGPGPMSRYFQGARVACLWDGKRDGVWAQYVVASAKGGVLPLRDSVSLEQGATSVINPLTATAFIGIAKKGGHDAIVLTAAASSLGRMINRLAPGEGIEVINVVRRDAQTELLRNQGASIVLNSTDSDFDEALRDACHQHDAHLAFDAVAGQMTTRMLRALPSPGMVTVYGALSFEAPQVAPDQLIFENKSMDGFWLGPFIQAKNLLQIMLMWRRAQKLLSTDLKAARGFNVFKPHLCRILCSLAHLGNISGQGSINTDLNCLCLTPCTWRKDYTDHQTQNHKQQALSHDYLLYIVSLTC